MHPPLHRREGPSWWSRHGGTVVMFGAILLILNDPIDRLLPVSAPALAPGPTTTWDPAVVMADGKPSWAAAGEVGRATAPGAPHEAWPAVQAALTAAGLPRATPERSIADLRSGKRPEPAPAELKQLREAAKPVLELLAGAEAQAVYAVTAEARRGLLTRPVPAHEAIRQLIAAAAHGELAQLADPANRLRAAGRLLPIIPLAAGCEDLAGAQLAHQADAAFWRALLCALAAAPGDAAVRARADELRGRHRLPEMPAALRRTRLAVLEDCSALIAQILAGGGGGQLRINHPPDVNHALALLNAWFDGLARTLPPDPADGRACAIIATQLRELPQFDLADARERRTLAARMLFDDAVDERRRQTATVIASLYELLVWSEAVAAARQARRALLQRAAVQALLATPGTASAAALARELTAALPALPACGGSIAFTADGAGVRIALALDGTDEPIATLRTEQP